MDQEVADTLFNIGNVYHNTKRPLYALNKYEEAIEILKSLHGEHHQNIAENMSLIGEIYERLGDYKKGRKIQKEALKIYELIEKEKKN